MLIEPSSSKKPHRNEDNEVVRVKHIYENCSERFCLGERKFTRQYAHLYAVRLHKMRDSVTEAAKQKWGSDVPVRKLFELNMHEKSIIIGTSFKYMKMKPSILKEISEENHFALQPVRDKYFDEEDYLILEDELQRINLIENIDPQMLVTGIVMAVLGEEDDDGKFIVEDVCFSGIAEQIPRKLIEDDMYVALVSGLGLGNSGESLFPLQLMVDFLAGNLGDENDLHSCAKIVRLIIAGNSLSRSTQNKDFTTKAKYLTRKIPVNTVEAVKTLDDFLEQLVNTMDVDIIPGDYDPSNYLLPQQPLHKCILPKSGNYSTMHNVSNPYECRIQNLRFLGTSGQTLNDIKKYSKLDDPMNIMEKTLEWGHLAPTAPDTLSCYPFYDEDPFIVTTCPDVYFVGNQPSFETKLFRGSRNQEVRLITLPCFAKTHTLILLNLRNLQCRQVNFDDSYFGK